MRSVWQWLVISSLIGGLLAAAFAAPPAAAETRPQYGGTLRVAMRAAPASLDPADSASMDSFARRNLTFLIFETLVTTDAGGRLHPGLATAWTTTDHQQWQFRLRPGIQLHDGTPLTTEIAAASLRVANPSWKIVSTSDSVIIEKNAVDLELPAELALPRNAIVKREGNKLSGTGPFHINDWQPGKKLILAAQEDYWQGQPYLDGIEIQMGSSFHDQWVALELGRADVIEVAPEQVHRLATEAPSVAASKPVELLALLFARDPQTVAERSLREALALTVDRASIRSVLLQGAGQPTGAILPDWMTGYGFVFPSDADLPRARQQRDRAGVAPVWTLGYDSGDPLTRLLADRIALNARDAAFTLQPTTAASVDLRLVRIQLASSDPWIALRELAASSGLNEPGLSQSGLNQPASEGMLLENLYTSEQAMLASGRIFPLFHLPVAYAISANLRDWKPLADGTCDLANVWLTSSSRDGKP